MYSSLWNPFWSLYLVHWPLALSYDYYYHEFDLYISNLLLILTHTYTQNFINNNTLHCICCKFTETYHFVINNFFRYTHVDSCRYISFFLITMNYYIFFMPFIYIYWILLTISQKTSRNYKLCSPLFLQLHSTMSVIQVANSRIQIEVCCYINFNMSFYMYLEIWLLDCLLLVLLKFVE